MTFEYAPAPESRAIVDLRASYGLFIDGEFVEPTDGTTFKTVNPATEEVVGQAPNASAADARAAAAAANQFPLRA